MRNREIANEIFNKMYSVDDVMGNYPMCFDTAKKCALITVDYIIETLKEIDITGHIPSERFEDWNDIKKEINEIQQYK